MRPTPMLICCALAWLLTPGIAPAQQRDLLYPAEVAGGLKAAADAVRDLTRDPVPYDKLSPKTDYYVRVVPRRVILDVKNRLQPRAVLGGKPFVFLTSPQGVTGKSLLDVLLDTGHEPADLLVPARNEDMVALVFAYPPAVGVSAARDGTLPADWARKVHVPTWENVSAVFGKLAAAAAINPDATGGFQPVKLSFKSEAERSFVVNYPPSGLARLKKTKTVPYDALMRTGGADWEYRKLLEDKLSVFAHFRGTGRTVNVVVDPRLTRADSGIFEYLGPNCPLADLPELAVVHLGRLEISDGYRPRRPARP